ncbi:cell division protein ZapA [Anaerovoracaceae bacterium 41-7]|jgi:cell division protein ZapA|uniref:Cell division protein ZapA n=1 Tax=Anaerotruncus colihominis TaxID=169435 RepID=A0A845QHQ1_9FIRM|nr:MULTISPECIES: cell division protein ZapA [Clostridia]MCI9475155.1 cell division protein ZapA [Emergencia sp.]MCI9638530.1 cell division protein ZapA [Emergencia sp.]NBH60207.1 cell division protein ZapA [Anaerotruncus colihominis]NCF00138.1 cell division protein ZapA [Emergencia sp. 1XD21-10]NCF00861.1 cell division protein ZapA [Anaerotruncus sp. 80]
MDSKVTVKIYGQEYTIAGDKSEEEITRIAEYVDNKMRLISRACGDAMQGNISILSAINIAEEYFEALREVELLRTAKQQMENDSKYYLKMWEDAKKNFAQYKDNMAEMKNQKQESDERFKELQSKCTEFENSFFDLQMENIQLKSELEKLKNNR